MCWSPSWYPQGPCSGRSASRREHSLLLNEDRCPVYSTCCAEILDTAKSPVLSCFCLDYSLNKQTKKYHVAKRAAETFAAYTGSECRWGWFTLMLKLFSAAVPTVPVKVGLLNVRLINDESVVDWLCDKPTMLIYAVWLEVGLRRTKNTTQLRSCKRKRFCCHLLTWFHCEDCLYYFHLMSIILCIPVHQPPQPNSSSFQDFLCL